MTIPITPLAAMALVLVLAAGTSDPLAGRRAGQPQQCIDLGRNDALQIADGHTITFAKTAQRTWVVHPAGSCPSLSPQRKLVIGNRTGQACAGDRFRVLTANSSLPSGFCKFGAFVPYDRP